MTARDIFSWLELAIKDKKEVLMGPDQCRLLLGWANEVTERKNEVVRENMALAVQLEILKNQLASLVGT